MILKIFIVVAVLIAAILIFAATRPDAIRVQRSIEINAPPEKIFALINDFHNWSLWAPQDKEDSTMVRTFSGSASGMGGVSDWTSKGSAGQGSMSITESTPPHRIVIQVDFLKPFRAHNVNEFSLETGGTSTKVTWTMQGASLFFMKLMSIFVNMDRVMGRHFETGLNNLKAVAEK